MGVPKETFEALKNKYAGYSSWAIWAPQIEGMLIKSGIDDISMFDDPGVVKKLHSDYVIVALNISQPIERPFGNFHSQSAWNTDYKMRYAFEGTPLWGSYMTDILKDVCEVDSQKIANDVKGHIAEIARHADIFAQELAILGAEKATIVTLGGLSDRLTRFVLKRVGLSNDVVTIYHYAHYMGHEKYRAHVAERLSGAQ